VKDLWQNDPLPPGGWRPVGVDCDLYIELTTLKQSLVTEKNRKMRRFWELYPEVKLKVVYGRDYRSLLAKYGLEKSNSPK